MEWKLNIPKILHVYWGGSSLNYLRFLTVKSFLKHNPDWSVNFLYPKYPSSLITWINPEQKYYTNCDDYTEELKKISTHNKEIDFEKYGFKNSMSEVHKSDFIRLEMLSTIGGVWSDMDILYLKPMSSLYFNSEEYSNIETFLCDHMYGHSIGFLLGSENNVFFNKLKYLSKREFSPDYYQSIGVHLYNKYFSNHDEILKLTPYHNISMDVVYPYTADTYEDLLSSKPPKFPEKSIGVHWYGGSQKWKTFFDETNGGLKNLYNNIISGLIKHVQ